MKHLRGALVVFVLVSIGCANHPPPTLTPQAITAWWGTRVIKDLDILRDTAVDANAQMPPLIDTATTRRIVAYHESAIKTVHDAPLGWRQTVDTGLVELKRSLSSEQVYTLGSYIDLVRAALKEIP